MESEKIDHTPHRSVDHGTFLGHFGIGSIYLVLSFLWMYNTLFRYHVARHQAILEGSDSKELNYKNTLFSTYHSGWKKAIPTEGIGLVLVAILSGLVELSIYRKEASLMALAHHLFLYSSFGVLGLVEILRHYKFAMPPASEYVMFIAASAFSAFLFSNHEFNKEIVNKQMHVILAYYFATTILCTAVELMHPSNPTLALSRIVVMMAQGFWMSTMGFIAYPLSFMPAYDLNDHGLLAIVKFLAVVDIGVALVVAFAMNAVIAIRVRSMNLSSVNYQRVPTDCKGKAGCPLTSDSDGEI